MKRFDRSFLKDLLFLLLGDAAVSYLFYRHALPFFLFLPLFPAALRALRKERIAKEKDRISYDFIHLLDALLISFRAGYAAENAFAAAVDPLAQSLGSDHPLSVSCRRIRSGLTQNRPLNELISEFAEEHDVEVIRNFCSVFLAATRSGGDLPLLIESASQQIRGRLEAQREIDLAVAAKRFEQRILSGMPALLLLYMQLTSPDFLSVLYGNLPGAAFMTVCLVLYAFAFLLGSRILSIPV